MLTYEESKVNKEEFVEMFVRGDSEKAEIDTNTLLSIWLVHGKTLYNYTYFSKKVNNVKIKKICNIHSKITIYD